jgi:hypothetical protein
MFIEDSKFTQWTSWEACSQECDTGSQHRRRYCTDASNGGDNCPAKNLENLELYKQKRNCNKQPCPSKTNIYYIMAREKGFGLTKNIGVLLK